MEHKASFTSVLGASLILLALATILLQQAEARPGKHRHHHHHHHAPDSEPQTEEKPHSDQQEPSPRPSHKTLEADRISAFKRGILERMTGGPPRVGNATAEELRAALRLYRQAVREEEGAEAHELYQADEEAMYAKQFHSFPVHSLGSWMSADEPEVIRLHVPVEIPQPEDGNLELKVSSAQIKLYRLAANPQNVRDERTVDLQVRVNVYQLLEDSDEVKQPLRKLISSQLISLTQAQAGWETFDIKEAFDLWLNEPSSNHGLEIAAVGDEPISDVLTFELDGGENAASDVQAHVSAYTQEVPIIARQKRSADGETYDCKQGDGETRCCRYPLWIDFEHIDWDDWVVQPAGYQAYFCDGSCPHKYKLAHNFASIKAVLNLVNPAAVPAPCCTASKLSAITVLHYNHQGHLVVHKYEDMVVGECLCA